MLSPGEMQRLSFVRLFFHQPPFACKYEMVIILVTGVLFFTFFYEFKFI